MLIGKKLKALRKERKVSLTELSKRSGVQLATLSRIENMKMTGTLKSHNDIAQALGISLIELYGDSKTDYGKAQKKKPLSFAKVSSQTDKTTYEILTRNPVSKRMLPMVIEIKAGGKTKREKNQLGTEKFIFMLSGKVDMHVGKEVCSLSKYDTLYFDASKEHHLVNTENDAAKALCVTSPVSL